MKKKILDVLSIIILGIFLSSCSISDKILNKVDGVVEGKPCDVKLYNGIESKNFEDIKEALEDGADINHIRVPLETTQTNPILISESISIGDITDYLINNGANVNYTNSSGISLLMDASFNIKTHLCESLIKRGAKVNKKDKYDYSAIEYAVDNNQNNVSEIDVNNIVTLLLNNGAKIRPLTLKTALHGKYSTNDDKYIIVNRILKGLLKSGYKSELNPVLEAAILGKSSDEIKLIKANKMNKEDEMKILFYTAAYGNVDVMKLLETKGINIKAEDNQNNTTLIVASQCGNLEMVKYLLGRGIDIEAQDKVNDTALRRAVSYNQLETAQYLISQGAKMIYKQVYDGYMNEVLVDAAQYGNVDMMRLLLANGYPSDKETMGSAFTAAVDHNQKQACEYLLNNGANPNLIGKDGFTPFVDSCIHCNFDLVKLLAEHGAKADGSNLGDNPLITASRDGNVEIVEYLINKGANINAVYINTSGNDKGLKSESALMYAIQSGKLDIIKILIKNGANIEYEDEDCDYDTAVVWAASNPSRHVLEYIIQKGANINYQNKKGDTALMCAVSEREKDNVNILLKYKADKNLKNKDGQTALDIAREKGYNEIVNILKKSK